MKAICIYKNNQEICSTAPLNPLIYNVVRGFSEIAARTYSDKLKEIKLNPYVISVVHPAENVVIFSVDSCAKNLEKAVEIYTKSENGAGFMLKEELIKAYLVNN